MLDQFPQYSPFQEQPETRMSSSYGMNDESPMQPVSTLPALFPNIMTPEQYPQAPFSSPNLMQARYAEGGAVHPQDMMMASPQEQMQQQMPPDQMQQIPQQGLSELAQLIQQHGQGEDTVLAHINREEAELLAQKYGYDVNPMTGLPQFGLFKKIKKGFKKVFKGAKKLGRYALPIAGTVGGAMVGGPMGATIGGGLGGALGAGVNKKNILKGGLLGAAGGYGASQILPGIAPNFAASIGLPGRVPSVTAGAPANDLKSYIQNARNANLANAFQKTLPGGGGTSNLGQQLLPTALNALTGGTTGQGGGSLLGSLLGNGGSNLVDNGLALTALLGTVLGREKKSKETSLAKLAQQLPPKWGPKDQPRALRPYKREYIPLPKGYDPTIHGEHQFFKDVNPWQYHEGGGVDMQSGGYLNGDTDGHADKIPAKLSDGEYVIDATTVAHLGNGNNHAGAKVLDLMVKNVRHHKGVKGFPPKAKSLHQYMQMKHR